MNFKNIILKPELNDKLEKLLLNCLDEEKIKRLASNINKYYIDKNMRSHESKERTNYTEKELL